MPSRTQAIVARLVPATIIIGLATYTVVGPGGFLDLMSLRRQASETRQHWASLEKENDHLLLEVQQMQTDPIHLERMVADELGLAREGATLYYFDDEDGAVVRTKTP